MVVPAAAEQSNLTAPSEAANRNANELFDALPVDPPRSPIVTTRVTSFGVVGELTELAEITVGKLIKSFNSSDMMGALDSGIVPLDE